MSVLASFWNKWERESEGVEVLLFNYKSKAFRNWLLEQLRVIFKDYLHKILWSKRSHIFRDEKWKLCEIHWALCTVQIWMRPPVVPKCDTLSTIVLCCRGLCFQYRNARKRENWLSSPASTAKALIAITSGESTGNTTRWTLINLRTRSCRV